MICPKCKKQIPEKSLKCIHCGVKIATFCKNCHAYNSIYNLHCVNCNNVLLKVCPSCNSVNLPNAAKCRKCEYNFPQKIEHKIPESDIAVKQVSPSSPITEIIDTVAPTNNVKIETANPVNEEIIEKQEEVLETEEEKNVSPLPPSFVPDELYTQQKAKELIINGLTSLDKKIISLSGPKGIGKTIVLKSAIQDLKDYEITWLIGECSPLTQLSPCGLIQDMLLTFFNITDFCSDNARLKKDSQKFFHTEFPNLTNEEIFNLLNLVYPTNSDYFENILQNKEKTFAFLEKVFTTIIDSNKTIFVIEDFDLIDGFSYEFLHKFVNKTIASKHFKFLITYDEARPARGYLYSNDLKGNAYMDISLRILDKNQMNAFIDQYFYGETCPQNVKEQLFTFSSGNAALLEQGISLVSDFKLRNHSFDITIPNTLDKVIKMRLDFLKENQAAYNILSLAAIEGMKFNFLIINQISKLAETDFINVLGYLKQLNFIVPVNDFAYEFKNSLLWKTVFETIKQDENFIYLNESIYTAYSNYTLSSNSLMAVIAQNINQDLSAFNIWTDNIKLASYIGDTNLYAISQKQCLNLIEKLGTAVNTSLIKNNIYERLGKLLTNLNPTEAMEYLPEAVLTAKKQENLLKEIELTGYLASCCMDLGDYYGIIECIDSVVNKLSPDFELEIAMLKTRKLSAILSIGNSGEIVNLIDNEIMPVLEKYIGNKPHKNISVNDLYKSWLNTYLTLANALVFQGNNRSFDILDTLNEILQKNKFDNKLFICKTRLALAFANTIKGDTQTSENILGDIIKVYKTDIMDNEAISRWNLINILNNFIQKKYSGLKDDLFEVVTFANNINDHFTKNILKTMLGKLFKDEENAKRGLDIYSEQITYFAKEKNALGALLTWYLMSEAELIIDGPDKALEIAQRALEVAQSIKINNYLFIALYNRIIAEAYMVQAEYELAKVHIEKAVLVAKKFEMFIILADLYLLYGKYLQDIALVKTDAQIDYVHGASKMYKKAFLMAEGLKNNALMAKIEKSKTALNSFCQLNGINLTEK